jgi:Tfp pilus assembly protein PilO
MNRLFELLRERPLAWSVPLVLLVVNLLLLSTYRAIYSGRVVALESQIESEEGELDELRELSSKVQDKVLTARQAQEGIESLYRETFATEEERLTSLIREVRQLAIQAGLRPDSISYPQERIEDFGLYERSINFDVEGSYEAVRRFINFLELSDSFLVLHRLSLNQSSQQEVRIALSLSTLFSGRDLAPEEEG